MTTEGSAAEDRDGFRFRGDSRALDLTATLQGRLRGSTRELLTTPQDLDRWLVSAGLTSSPPRSSAADLATAHELREAVYALVESLNSGFLDAGACKVLNRIAAVSPGAPVLKPDRTIEVRDRASGLLASLAREAAHLLGSDQAQRIRQCASPSCAIYFVDTSRSGKRRWCSMSACGNKAKVAALRDRGRKAPR